jgi:hypothetical protein
MGYSADAYLFYGMHADTGGSTPEAWDELESKALPGKTYGWEYQTWLAELGVSDIEISSCGYFDYPTHFIAIKSTLQVAIGWDIKPVETAKLQAPSREQCAALDKVASLLAGAAGDDFEWSDEGWWLAPGYG